MGKRSRCRFPLKFRQSCRSYLNLSFFCKITLVYPSSFHMNPPTYEFLGTQQFSLARFRNMKQLDFELALWQMLHLIISPKKVYRNIYHHKQTSNKWARDDPAFVIILVAMLLVTAVFYAIAYQVYFSQFLFLCLYMVLVDFFLVGVIVASATYWFSNTHLIGASAASIHSNQVEWAYCFDVHCNSFFPVFLCTYVIQFFLIAFLKDDTLFSRLFGNTLYYAAACLYIYITFLGFNVLFINLGTSVFEKDIRISLPNWSDFFDLCNFHLLLFYFSSHVECLFSEMMI